MKTNTQKALPANWPSFDYWPTFLFYRYSEMEGSVFFYPVSLPNEDEIIPNIRRNPGTIKVTDLNGKVIWSAT